MGQPYTLRERKWVCSNGHEFGWAEMAAVRLGDEEWCLACLAEKLNPMLRELGIGKVTRKEGE